MSITYETAKKLKEAGFPQRETDVESDPYLGTYLYLPGTGPSEVYAPSLSELITACGQDFWRLEVNWGSGVSSDILPEDYTCHKWYASSRLKEGDVFKIIGESGDTAEEAVANLFLMLHNK